MNNLQITNKIFFNDNFDPEYVKLTVTNSLNSMDDGELYLEYTKTSSIQMDDSKIKLSSLNIQKGYGLRAVIGDASSYTYSNDFTHDSITASANIVTNLKRYGTSSSVASDPINESKSLYVNTDVVDEINYADKVNLMRQIDNYIREKSVYVKQVSITISSSWKCIKIIRCSGIEFSDIRPLVSISVYVIVEKNGRSESGSYRYGGRMSHNSFISEEKWQYAANNALDNALTALESIAAPAGEMVVILGSGWPGILLHEAVGHGLEGDFNRKRTSIFAHLMNQKIAAKGVTIVDDGTISDRRGSISFDDEGTTSKRNILVEDGILKKYMQDRMNARLMGVEPTGNGRRQDYTCQPQPRMTNTFMLPGKDDLQNLISTVKDGVYAKNFGGGQVDIVSGNFMFEMSEAYKIENGRIMEPLKGATLIGNGPEVMNRVVAICDDLHLDPGVGVCQKNGQSIAVGVGQPSLMIDKITVGGTKI